MRAPLDLINCSEQRRVAALARESDDDGWDWGRDVRVVGGLDISFVKDSTRACACLVLLSFPEMRLLGFVLREVAMEEPYVSGFLAFREEPALHALLGSHAAWNAHVAGRSAAEAPFVRMTSTLGPIPRSGLIEEAPTYDPTKDSPAFYLSRRRVATARVRDDADAPRDIAGRRTGPHDTDSPSNPFSASVSSRFAVPDALRGVEAGWTRVLSDAADGRFPAIPVPDVVFVDGNGRHHPRRCGSATHLGVACNLRTIGVAKTLMELDGLSRDRVDALCRAQWSDDRDRHVGAHAGTEGAGRGGRFPKSPAARSENDWVPLVGDSGQTWGGALRTASSMIRPMFVSVGHRVSLDTAHWITRAASRHRIPEPTRWADLWSREWLRRVEAAEAARTPTRGRRDSRHSPGSGDGGEREEGGERGGGGGGGGGGGDPSAGAERREESEGKRRRASASEER